MVIVMLRQSEEILEKIKYFRHAEAGTWAIKILVQYLPFHHASPFFSNKLTFNEWRQFPLDRPSVLYEMRNHMAASWEAANNFRGMTCWRNLARYNAWLWLLGDDHLFGDLTQNQEFYGKSELVKICRHYGWDYSEWDDGVRLNSPPRI